MCSVRLKLLNVLPKSRIGVVAMLIKVNSMRLSKSCQVIPCANVNWKTQIYTYANSNIEVGKYWRSTSGLHLFLFRSTP